MNKLRVWGLFVLETKEVGRGGYVLLMCISFGRVHCFSYRSSPSQQTDRSVCQSVYIGGDKRYAIWHRFDHINDTVALLLHEIILVIV